MTYRQFERTAYRCINAHFANQFRILSTPFKNLYLCTAFRRQTIPPIGGFMRNKRKKIKIAWYAHDLYDPRIIHARTAQGERLLLTQCIIPDKRRVKSILYSDGKMHFFSLCRSKLTEVFDNFGLCCRTPGLHCHNGKRGNDYPQMRDYGAWYCHIIVLLTFQGPRPIGDDGKPFEGDHKNGCVTDYSNDNLEWVSKKENRRRSKVLKALRSIDIDPVQVPYNILDVFLNPKIISNMSVLTTRLTKLRELHGNLFTVFAPEDFHRWLTMPESEFDQMVSD